MTQPFRRVLRLFFLAAVMAGFAFVCRDMSLALLWQAICQVSPWSLAAAVALNFLNLASKATCWWILLRRRFAISWWYILRYTLGAFALSIITPLRAGEAMRVWLLHQRHKVPLPMAVSVAAVDKALDALAMLLLVAPLPLLMPRLPTWLGTALDWAEGMAAVGIVLVAVVLCGWPVRRWPKLQPYVAHLTQHRLRDLTMALLALVAGWLADLALVWLVLDAIGIDLPRAAGLVVLLIVNLAIAVPSTPGQVGTLELSAAATLQVLGVGQEQAMAFGLLYHGVQVFPLLIYLAGDGRFFWRAVAERSGKNSG